MWGEESRLNIQRHASIEQDERHVVSGPPRDCNLECKDIRGVGRPVGSRRFVIPMRVTESSQY